MNSVNSGIGSVLGILPALAAGVFGALLPKRLSWVERAGVGLISALLVGFVLWAWPGATSAASSLDGKPGEWPYLLSVLIGLPMVGSVVVILLPGRAKKLLRGVTLVVLFVDFVASFWLLRVPMSTGWHFVYIQDWIPAFGIRYHVAVDGISLWLVLLTTFITPIAAYATFGSITARTKELCFSFLLVQTAMIGMFVSIDLFLFYVFWELMLVPIFLMSCIWGTKGSHKAGLKLILFSMVGSVLMLASILYMVSAYSKLTGEASFSLLALNKVLLPQEAQTWCFWGFAIALFIRVPMVPLHTWLPDSMERAPTAASILLSAVVLNTGAYAYMRLAMGLFPWAAGSQCATLAGFATIGGIVYAAICAWKQDNINRTIAYLSVMHLGVVMLGLFALTQTSTQGALFHMVSHGITTTAILLLVNAVFCRTGTNKLSDLGGLAKPMPVLAAFLFVVGMASIGVPSTSGFVGNFMVTMGAYSSTYLAKFSWLDATLAALGVAISAACVASTIWKILFGPQRSPPNLPHPDLNTREVLALTPLVIVIFVLGLFPSTLLTRSSQAVSDFHTRNRFVWMRAQDATSGPARMLTNEQLAGVRPGSPNSIMLDLLNAMDEGRPVPRSESKPNSNENSSPATENSK